MLDLTDRLTEVFRIPFGDEALVLEPSMTADDVAGWDSVAHITPIYAIEDAFGIKFGTRDLEGLTCAGDLIETVRRRA